ncbi:CdaR family transcriptional regulator [Fundidesulfovibrio agrisoli]|uniref:CdaR family transcriptional regulator n=1 Tax=Fundidesulfovibrio agrisoli TaxID=2922717 RepID=UPI001FAB403F|nr:sugar diacid recognition domain-containing protein [Fundidesulfovibrio agrisoli]
MIIPDALAQHIVDSAQEIVRCNVNIMDREGIIIGTAQPERYRTFHKGARDVIESGVGVEIQPQDVSRYPGALQGVNLPIVLEGQVIGVIGVTGDPGAVRGPARLIKMITELILEREFTHQEMQSRQRLAEQVVEMLVGGGEHYRRRITRAAKTLDFDLDIPRLVAVVDVSALLRGFSSEYGPSELVLERSAEAILEGLAACGGTGPQDLAVILDRRLVVLKRMEESPREVRAWGERLKGAFEAWDVGRVACGAGAVALSLDEYPLSYRQAKYCLHAKDGRAFRSIYDHAHSVGYLLDQTSAGPAAMPLRPLSTALADAVARKPELLPTLDALAANNFESDQAAYSLSIHRNTLAYRLARLRDLTGLEPAKRLDDAILLKALLGMMRG